MFTFTRNEETTSSKKTKTNETENEETKNVEAEKEETKDTESENKETKDAKTEKKKTKKEKKAKSKRKNKKSKKDGFEFPENYMGDQFVASMAILSDNYANNVPDEIYTRLAGYVSANLYVPRPKEDEQKGQIYLKKLTSFINLIPNDYSDNATEEQEEKKEEINLESEESTKEEDEKIISFVEHQAKKEKEENQEKKKSKSSNSIKKYVKDYITNNAADAISKGVKEEYRDTFDNFRDDLLDLYNTYSKTSSGKKLIDDASSNLEHFIAMLDNADVETINKVVRDSNFKSADLFIQVVEVCKKLEADKRLKIVLDSIMEICIAEAFNEVTNTVFKASNDNKDEVINKYKTFIVETKNDINNHPDDNNQWGENNVINLARETFKSIIDSISGILKDVDEAIKPKFNTSSKFIPDEPEEPIKFGDYNKKPIRFDFDKMILNRRDEDVNNNVTKKLNGELLSIQNQLDELIDKNVYQYTLTPLINGLVELKIVGKGDLNCYPVDIGNIIGHGEYVIVNGIYISFREKDILKRLFDNPNKFKLSKEEEAKCNSYLFNQVQLYQYLDMTTIKPAEKIKKLSDEDYRKLGDIIYILLQVVFYKNYGITCRFRFKDFKSINEFVLVSDSYVKYGLKNDIPIANLLTTISYNDNKVVISYGGQVTSYNL